MKGRKIKSERIAKTCGAALAVSLVVANVNFAVCEVGASAPAGRGIQSSVNVNQQAALTLTPTPSVTPLLKKISPTPTATAAPTATPIPTQVPAATETPMATQAPVLTEAPLATQAPAATEVPVATEVPMATETPAATETSAPAFSGESETLPTGTPEESAAPDPDDENDAPETSVTPGASETPTPENSLIPEASAAPGEDSSEIPEASGVPATETSVPSDSGETGEEDDSVQSQPDADVQPEDGGASGMPISDSAAEQDSAADAENLPDVSFAGSEELVGFTTFTDMKKSAAKSTAASVSNAGRSIAGSSPLVGGEIADNIYGGSAVKTTEAPKMKATSTPTETPISDWSTEMVDSLSSDEDEGDAPVIGAPGSSGNYDSSEEETPVETSRFGVLTGDTTDIFSYMAMGVSSVIVAFLTFVTMCARGRRRPEKDRPEK